MPIPDAWARPSPPLSSGVSMYIIRIDCIPQNETKSHRATLMIGIRAFGWPPNDETPADVGCPEECSSTGVVAVTMGTSPGDLGVSAITR